MRQQAENEAQKVMRFVFHHLEQLRALRSAKQALTWLYKIGIPFVVALGIKNRLLNNLNFLLPPDIRLVTLSRLRIQFYAQLMLQHSHRMHLRHQIGQPLFNVWFNAVWGSDAPSSTSEGNMATVSSTSDEEEGSQSGE